MSCHRAIAVQRKRKQRPWFNAGTTMNRISLSVWSNWAVISTYLSHQYSMWSKLPSCASVQDDPYILSTWDGSWSGLYSHGAKVLGNVLRLGWSFVPLPETNCKMETFSRDDLLSIPTGPNVKEKSIHFLGMSGELC